MKRREFLRRSGSATLGVFAGSSLLLNACHTEEDMMGKPNWIVEGSFDMPLNIPSVFNGGALEPDYSAAQITKNMVSSTMAYQNGILGPTIRAPKGTTLNVELHNHLEEKTNIHWHGLILPEDMDGHPLHVAEHDQSIYYQLPIQQRAGTYWYHPHPHGATARQVFMGLAGMFIVTDDEEAALNLPSGEFEVPIIIQDKRFNGTNLTYAPNEDEIMTGYLGEQILVNGIQSPMLNVAKGWYRFRILNGSTARLYNLAFTESVNWYIIGSDGGLLTTPEQVSSIFLAPGERLDILADFSQLSTGQDAYLVSHRFSEFSIQGRQSFKIMRFRVDRDVDSSFTLPSQLSTITKLSASQAVKTRSFDIASTVDGGSGGHGGMGRHAINGKIFDMDRIDETVAAGTTEIWEFDNMMGDEIHPMHIHGVQFQVLSRMGGRNQILASEKGWKDTVLLMPGERVQMIMTFPEYRGMFVFHCHNLEHEDDGMMLNYRIE